MINSQYFIGGLMPESAVTAKQSATIIEIRPYRGGWQCFEGDGVQPYFIETATIAKSGRPDTK